MRHPAHVSFVGLGAAFGQQRRFLGQRAQQLGQPAVLGIALVGLEVAQHPVQHQVLVAGMADADAHPAIVLADMGVDVAQAVVAAGTAALLHAHPAGREVELVVEHHDAVERDLEEAHGLAHGLARLVHEGHGLQDQRALAAEMAFRHLAVEARPPRREDTAADDLVHRHESRHCAGAPRSAARDCRARPAEASNYGLCPPLTSWPEPGPCRRLPEPQRLPPEPHPPPVLHPPPEPHQPPEPHPRLPPEPPPLPPHRPPPGPPPRAPRSARRSRPRWRSCRGSPRARPRASSAPTDGPSGRSRGRSGRPRTTPGWCPAWCAR